MVTVAKSFDAPIKLLFPRGLDAVRRGQGFSRGPVSSLTPERNTSPSLRCIYAGGAKALHLKHARCAHVPTHPQAGLRQFSMLGLGDIVIPGVFVAIMLRYDAEQGFKSKYFYR